MRRADREIADTSAIDAILQRATVCHIALADADGPYIVPVCFGYHASKLYFHSATAGRKLDMLARDGRVCFEVEVDVEVLPADRGCDWSVRYASVIGFGTASVVTDDAEKRLALNLIVEHYGGEAEDYGGSDVRRVAIVRVDVDRMTGKRAV